MKHITACYQLNANQKYYPITKLFNEIINQKYKQVCYSKIIQYAIKRYYVCLQETLHVLMRTLECISKLYEMYS